jgi:hypothetical protein
MKCTTCNQEYSPDCDWQQGRCPHHPPLFNIQPKDTSRGHFYVSLVKSATRIAAGISLVWPQSIVLAGVFLIAAEILGVIEELV